jgi:hypothetical protein
MDNNPKPMKYGLIGEDSQTIDEKLKKYSGIVDWNYIRPHYKNGNLVYVDPSLDIQSVGRAFSVDDKSLVKKWLDNGDLIIPSEPHETYWEKEKPNFLALIVSPFILIQPA